MAIMAAAPTTEQIAAIRGLNELPLVPWRAESEYGKDTIDACVTAGWLQLIRLAMGPEQYCATIEGNMAVLALRKT